MMGPGYCFPIRQILLQDTVYGKHSLSGSAVLPGLINTFYGIHPAGAFALLILSRKGYLFIYFLSLLPEPACKPYIFPAYRKGLLPSLIHNSILSDTFSTSAFDCAGGEAADDVLDEAEVQDDDGYRDEHAARGKARELGVRHRVEPHGDGPHLALLEQQLGQQAVAPGPCELGESGVDQHGL